MSTQPIIIGISGRAGSGKDTVKDMISVYFNYHPKTLEEFKIIYKNQDSFLDHKIDNVVSIAFADRLKEICSTMFNIDIKLFYDRDAKENKYINLKTHELVDYSYEISNKTVNASTYYNNYDSPHYKSSFMSLRELMVYVGTYLIKYNFDNNFFINSVNSFINSNFSKDAIIVSDVRFTDEFEYISKKHGISILVKNNRVTPLNNIAENIWDEEEFDFEIINDGSFDDLLENVYKTLTNHIIYKNIQKSIFNVGLRLIEQYSGHNIYEILAGDDDISGIDYDDCDFIDLNEHETVLTDKLNSININGIVIKPKTIIDGINIDNVYSKNNRYYIIVNV